MSRYTRGDCLVLRSPQRYCAYSKLGEDDSPLVCDVLHVDGDVVEVFVRVGKRGITHKYREHGDVLVPLYYSRYSHLAVERLPAQRDARLQPTVNAAGVGK